MAKPRADLRPRSTLGGLARPWAPWVVLLLVSMLALAPRAHAYTGGPALVEVLGWDAAERRVYLREFPVGDTGTFGVVYYFAFDSVGSVRRARVSWSHAEAREDNAVQLRGLSQLRQRLAPLLPLPGPVFPKGRASVASIDSVETPWGTRPLVAAKVLYEIGLTFEYRGASAEFAVKDAYRIPDTQHYLFIVVFRGNVGDSLLAETQVPVVVNSGEGDQTIRAVWEPQ